MLAKLLTQHLSEASVVHREEPLLCKALLSSTYKLGTLARRIRKGAARGCPTRLLTVPCDPHGGHQQADMGLTDTQVGFLACGEVLTWGCGHLDEQILRVCVLAGALRRLVPHRLVPPGPRGSPPAQQKLKPLEKAFQRKLSTVHRPKKARKILCSDNSNLRALPSPGLQRYHQYAAGQCEEQDPRRLAHSSQQGRQT